MGDHNCAGNNTILLQPHVNFNNSKEQLKAIFDGIIPVNNNTKIIRSTRTKHKVLRIVQ